MSFGLLTPLFLAGLAAIAIPVIVHLVHREEHMSFAFPSLMFLKRIPIREHRRRTIRHWWLLLLRCLVIALLCLAFAQPFIAWPTDIIASLSDSRDRVVLLDRSHSMQSGSRFDDAKAFAREAIDALGGGDRAALVLFDHDTLVTQKLTPDRDELRAALASADTGDGHTDLAGAIARASALLEKSDAASKEIIVVSDFQKSAVEPGEQPRIAPGIDVIPRPVTASAKANAAVAAVKLAHTALGDGVAVELSARIVNTSALPINSTDVVMEVDGRDREHRILDLEPGESRDVTFRLVLAPDELLQVRIHIGDDALEADNSLHVLVSGPSAIAVLLVEGRRVRPGKSLHLAEALRQGDTPGFRVTSRFASQLREADIDAADVVIIDDAPIPGGELGGHLRAFLQSGGGLLVAAGGGVQGTWPGGEDGIVPGRLETTRSRPETDPARLLGMDTLHPAFAAFAGGDGGDLSSAQVFRYRRLTGIDDDAVLARYDDEAVAVAEREIGRGRVLVLTTTLDPSWNTLALQPGYLPLVHESLKYLASHVPTTEAVAVGDSVDLAAYARGLPGYTRTAAALSRGTVTTLKAPSGRQTHMAPGEAFARVREAGFHAVHVSGGGPRSLVFAANPVARESDLTPLDVEAFVAAIGVEDAGVDTTQAARTVDTTVGRRAWWFLLLACALLLGLDTLISNRLSRSVRVS
jgi:Mg-chelatase subunit ChlD